MNMNNQEKNTYVREHILSALLMMLESTPISAIVVSDLVQKAGVGRASFYRNYASIEDILIQEERRLFEAWKESDKERTDQSRDAFVESLLNFYKSNQTFYLSLCHTGLSSIVRDTILSSIPIEPADPNPVAYVKSSIAYMIYGWVDEWMKRGMQESGTELVKMMNNAQGRK